MFSTPLRYFMVMLAIVFTLVVIRVASADHAVFPGDRATTSILCVDRDVLEAQMEGFKTGGSFVPEVKAAGQIGRCRRGWTNVSVVEVLKVGTDWEGDKMALVKVQSAPVVIYTIVWIKLTKHVDPGQGS